MIKLNLKDEKTISHLKNIEIVLQLILLLIFSIIIECKLRENEEIIYRYEQIKQDNTVLIKENQELNKMLKDTLEQDSKTNNLDTIY